MTERKNELTSEDAPTWRDYLPPFVSSPKLITRAELLADAPRWGAVDVSERTLRFWETAGALPRAVRQSHQGVVQAVYPVGYAIVVAAVYFRRKQGVPLPAIAAEMPQLVQGFAFMNWAIANKVMPLADAPGGGALLPHLAELARAGSAPDNPITRVTITLSDTQGEAVVNLLWLVPPEVLSNGEAISAPTDTVLSDGQSAPAPPDTF